MSASVYPTEVFPLIRSFLVANDYTTTVAAFDKELGKKKVELDKNIAGDLLDACKEYITALREKKQQNGKTEKRKAEDAPDQKAKKVKVDKKEEKEDSDSDSSSGSDAESDSSDSDSGSSDSDSSSSDSESSSSDSDSGSSASDSDSDSSVSDSDSSSEEEKKEKAKRKGGRKAELKGKEENKEEEKKEEEKKEKEEKKDKKKKEKAEEEKEQNGKTSAPTTPTANGNHTPANGTPSTSNSGKKNTPFRRVTEDDVALVNQKFADNTFESKRGDEYGRKANEILSQVKGKGFRTAKTKKKKGTYKGGPIDTRVNSVKFTFDDE